MAEFVLKAFNIVAPLALVFILALVPGVRTFARTNKLAHEVHSRPNRNLERALPDLLNFLIAVLLVLYFFSLPSRVSVSEPLNDDIFGPLQYIGTLKLIQLVLVLVIRMGEVNPEDKPSE